METRRYHLVLVDGTERDLKAYDVDVTRGVLTLKNSDDEVIVAYSEGSWRYVEVERVDDKE